MNGQSANPLTLSLVVLALLGLSTSQVCDYCRNPSSKCFVSQADVAILLQTTGSTDSTIFQQTLFFVESLLNSFSLGQCTVRVALASFSGGSVTTQFNFNSNVDNDDIYTITNSFQQGPDDSTLNLAVALYYMKRNIFTADAGSRSGVPKILVVVADNLQTIELRSSIEDASRQLRDDGVVIFAVGVGPKVDLTFLPAIADDNSREFYFDDGPSFVGPMSRIAQASICYDADECQVNNGGCSDVCVNTPGSYICACTNGTVLTVDQRTCIEADEGSGSGEKSNMEEEPTEDNLDYCNPSSNGGCCQICNSFQGGRNCSCSDGYFLHSDGRSCLDVNECFVSRSPCSHLCFNTPGSFFCQCPEDYKLDTDMKTCIKRPGPADCPKDFEVVSHSCMIKTNESGSFATAESFCSEVHNNSRLAKIADGGTRALVTRFFPGNTWIGLHYVDNRWLNSDGSVFGYEWAYAEPKIPGCGYVQNQIYSASCDENYSGACEIPRTKGFVVFGRIWATGTQGKLYMPTGINRVLVTFPKSIARFQVWYASIERRISARQFIITQNNIQRLSNNGHVGFVLRFRRFFFPNYRVQVSLVEEA